MVYLPPNNRESVNLSEVFQKINWVDILVIILLIRTSYIGAHAGLSVEIFKIIGILTGLYLSIKYYSTIGALLTSKVVLPPNISESATFLILILLSILTLKLVELGLTGIVKLKFADKLNKWGGFAVGLVRGLVISSLIFIFFTLTQADYLVKSIDERSITGPYIGKIAPFIYQIVSRNTLQGYQIRMPSEAGEKK
jgi:uncharacterized membrane protein required for colicin V production